ncbi:MAG: hypothetical protein AAFR17_10430 [Pseudomonadota bacterium]
MKRKRMSKAEIDILEEQILDILSDDHPQSVRHVFYRLTDPDLAVPIEKNDNGYRKVCTRMKAMRENGTLPYH